MFGWKKKKKMADAVGELTAEIILLRLEMKAGFTELGITTTVHGGRAISAKGNVVTFHEVNHGKN
jgi:hypothetical protein